MCANNLPLPMDAAETAVLDQFADCVLDPEIVEGAIEDALSELRPSGDAADVGRAALEAVLRRAEDERQRYVDAVGKVGEIGVLVKALRERDQRCADLQRELAALNGIRAARARPTSRRSNATCGRSWRIGGGRCDDRRPSPARC